MSEQIHQNSPYYQYPTVHITIGDEALTCSVNRRPFIGSPGIQAITVAAHKLSSQWLNAEVTINLADKTIVAISPSGPVSVLIDENTLGKVWKFAANELEKKRYQQLFVTLLNDSDPWYLGDLRLLDFGEFREAFQTAGRPTHQQKIIEISNAVLKKKNQAYQLRLQEELPACRAAQITAMADMCWFDLAHWPKTFQIFDCAHDACLAGQVFLTIIEAPEQDWEEIKAQLQQFHEARWQSDQLHFNAFASLFFFFYRQDPFLGMDELINRAACLVDNGLTSAMAELLASWEFTPTALAAMSRKHVAAIKTNIAARWSLLPHCPSLELAAVHAHEKALEHYSNLDSEDQKKRATILMYAYMAAPPIAEAILSSKALQMADWESFVVRRQEWQAEYKTDQQQYGSFMALTVQTLAQELRTQTTVDAQALLERCAAARRVIAHHLKQRRYAAVGIERNGHEPPYFTECSEIYVGLAPRLQERFRGPDSTPYKVQAHIPGYTAPAPLSTFEWTPTVSVYHPNFSIVPPVKDYVCRILHPQLWQERDSARRAELAGEIFWWICQAKLWCLGDPSIAELFIKSTLLAQGEPIYPWKVGLVPWEEAMLEETPALFGAKFATLWDRSD